LQLLLIIIKYFGDPDKKRRIWKSLEEKNNAITKHLNANVLISIFENINLRGDFNEERKKGINRSK
jgi:hypothetical protein